ncbi:putative membrane protein [Homoserinimonas aerilata]|uniref:Putative membrane protein n=1 Tax=Homoserinimonas aerilata TaxID=1162970 RepID=A0A542YHE4_9MICO|nr:DoxX family protein [Homoserinimonas aerilata]TQL47513.1 putative membrane protein [Homoserinimonas aerilata]
MLETVQTIIRIALALVFIGMGASHFVPTVKRTMAAMIPPRLRWAGMLSPRNLVVITGVLEIAGGIGLLIPATTVTAGVCLALLLIAVFPANSYAARRPEKFGRVAVPLVPRLIGQIVLIALVLFAVWPL